MRNLRTPNCQRGMRTYFSDKTFLMNAQSEKSLYDKLQDLKEKSGMSLRAIARGMGYSQASSIQRYFSQDYPHDSLPDNFVKKLLEVLPGKGNPAITREDVLALSDGVLMPTGTATEAKAPLPRPKPAGTVPILGEVAAGIWMEASLFENENQENSHIPFDPRFPVEAQFILRVRGESMNLVAPNGDYILCVDYFKAMITPKVDDLVLVERSKDGGMTIERTAKELVRKNGRVELMPKSSDPRFQEPISYQEGDPEATEVQIRAKIIMSYRPF
ncbi:LexA repressor [Roseibium alexandrii]|uniref:LexA repressor n=2 Tax=Roseibium alexandrii TaxID=388408 RepID=A0A0M6ZY22_9HYPH|nr:LexA repressor [Roseibium alexandrii]